MGSSYEDNKLNEKLAYFDTHWDPHVVADYNENEIMVVKFKGEFPFHKQDGRLFLCS